MTGLIVVTLIIVLCGIAWLWLRNKTSLPKRSYSSRRRQRRGFNIAQEKTEDGNKRKEEKLEEDTYDLVRWKSREKRAAAKLKNMRSPARGLPLYPLLAIVIVISLGIVGVLLLFGAFFSHPEEQVTPEVSEANILTMYSTAGEILAEYVVENYPEEGKILVLMPPEHLKTEGDEKILEKLKEKSDDKIVFDVQKIVVTDAGDSDEEGETEAEAKPWFSVDVFDRAISDHDSYNAVVSIAGLPARPEKIKFWHRDQSPDLILINSPLYRLEKLIRQGYIQAVLVRRPQISLDNPDVSASDTRKWLLVTADTLSDIQERYEGLMVKGGDL
ncbi:MAG: hypothetical protein ACOCQP_04030 [Lentisphaeria bacterium]